MYLDKSLSINTIAWLPEVPPTVLPSVLYFSGSSEYNQNEVILVGDVISTENTPYIIAQISASYIPSASGWYMLGVYDNTASTLTWDQANILWQDANWTWGNVPITVNLRVFVSGSNDPQVISFISNNETGSFTRYTSTNETGSFVRYISTNETGSFTRRISGNETGSFTKRISSNETGYFTSPL